MDGIEDLIDAVQKDHRERHDIPLDQLLPKRYRHRPPAKTSLIAEAAQRKIDAHTAR
jgi:hypothetical protein